MSNCDDLLNDEDYLAYLTQSSDSEEDLSNSKQLKEKKEIIATIHHKDKPKVCELCGDWRRTSLHHLIPKLIIKREKKRSRKSKKYKERRSFTEVHLVRLCKYCHSKLHKCFTHKELSEQYSTPDLISEHPDMIKYLKWKKKKVIHDRKKMVNK
ncbi:hypothetical protein M0813_05038 [Anaeramoeba flamelloides]|uniref:Uncharacterized protein n=1 Tax=Anaeramoeba flamelloides TaxID=1746091 RepID=A0ABQ8XI31_9EUKA|nr:hypothetical protein M0813_05038 [Anaeramoeba flamelloides]